MAHDIMNNDKFYSLRQPAWHGLGYVSQVEENILTAADRIDVPRIFERPVGFQGCDKWYKYPGVKALIGYTSEHGAKPLAIVTKRYHTFTHHDFIQSWHNAIDAPVETLGILGQGEKLFATVKLPSFDIQGDQVDNYLMGLNPCTGKDSISCRTTSVRVVCANTLAMALAKQTEHSITISHKSNPQDTFNTWLRMIWNRQTETLDLLKEAYSYLATHRISAKQADDLLTNLYPTVTIPDTKDIDILARWEKTNKHIVQRRVDVSLLWQNSPNNTQATDGTLWGLYNSVIEYEDYCRTKTSAESRMFGRSAIVKQTAFNACVALASI